MRLNNFHFIKLAHRLGLTHLFSQLLAKLSPTLAFCNCLPLALTLSLLLPLSFSLSDFLHRSQPKPSFNWSLLNPHSAPSSLPFQCAAWVQLKFGLEIIIIAYEKHFSRPQQKKNKRETKQKRQQQEKQKLLPPSTRSGRF